MQYPLFSSSNETNYSFKILKFLYSLDVQKILMYHQYDKKVIFVCKHVYFLLFGTQYKAQAPLKVEGY